MTIVCKNCNHSYEGNFCNNCGQRADTHQLNFHFLWHDIQHGLLHFDKGIFFTIKELFTRPGHAVREYIEGKRVKHFKPVSLVIILATFYGFLSHYFDISTLSIEGGSTETANYLLKKVMNWQAPIISLLNSFIYHYFRLLHG